MFSSQQYPPAMENLPLEILLQIASHNYHAWRGMLVVRSFAEFTLTDKGRNFVLRVFCKRDSKGRTTFCGCLHSFFDFPTMDVENIKKEWYHSGKLHRNNDLPAEVRYDGTMYWYRDDKLHRDGDLPAIMHFNGTKKWYCDGELHRGGDQPAVIYPDGTQIYYCDGLLHREGNKPAVITRDGAKRYYLKGEFYDCPQHKESS